MQTTRTNKTRSSYLPNISTPNMMSYAQRYEHMTKIANYNEMNEPQIWKEYEKLRVCLKQLNEEVLLHMEKKAHTNLYTKQAPTSPSIETTLTLLEEEKKANQTRANIFANQRASLETRVSQLLNRKNYLEDLSNEIELAEAKIKQMTLENKQLKRQQKLASKDLMSGATFLEKLVVEQQFLHFTNKKYEKYENIYKEAINKIRDYSEKKDEYQKVLDVRINQFKEQQDFISEQINLQRYEQLQNKKNNLAKYQSIYKRNYLMKLNQLEGLVNSINKHDAVIQETQGNTLNMRTEIDSISSVIVSNRKRNSVSMMQPVPRKASKSGRRSIMIDTSLDAKDNKDNIDNDKQNPPVNGNDKNQI